MLRTNIIARLRLWKLAADAVEQRKEVQFKSIFHSELFDPRIRVKFRERVPADEAKLSLRRRLFKIGLTPSSAAPSAG
jgi:hypothetical protein